MDDALDFVFAIDDGEISEAGFVEFVEDERAEDFGGFDEDHFGFWYHEVGNFAIVETHDGGNTVAIGGREDGLRSAF